MPGVQMGKERTVLGNASRSGSRGLGCLLKQDSGLLNYPVATPGTVQVAGSQGRP